MPMLSGQVALVTGAAGGIGQAICRSLRLAGARLALVDVDESALDAAAHECPGDDDMVVVADLTDDEETIALPGGVRAQLAGSIFWSTTLGCARSCSCSSSRPRTGAGPWTWTSPRRSYCQAAIPGMVEQSRGKIVKIASMAGALAFQNRAAYCTAKAGRGMLTKAITFEYGARGIWCTPWPPASARPR